MLRLVVVRAVALLLVLNGLGGLAAAWAGWGLVGDVGAELRDAGAHLAPEQSRIVAELREVGGLVGDAAVATDGFARSLDRSHVALADGSQAVADLAGTFERLTVATRIEIREIRPLQGLEEPFASSAVSFSRLSASLGGTADSLADNARDTARVSTDLHQARARIDGLARAADSARPQALLERGLGGLETGAHRLLVLLSAQALLSTLTGVALLLLAGAPRQQAAPEPLAM